MRHAGKTARQATAALARASTAQQNELLYRHGTNFNDLPAWQRRGIGLRWQEYDKTGRDPRTGTKARAIRRRLSIDDQLPVKDQYRPQPRSTAPRTQPAHWDATQPGQA